MSFGYLLDPHGEPAWRGILPGKPEPYILHPDQGEHSLLNAGLFTVKVSADETNGQFGVFLSTSPPGSTAPAHLHDHTNETFYLLEGRARLFYVDATGTKTSQLLLPGDLAYIPAGTPHTYRIEEQSTRILGVVTGTFERYFEHVGRPTDHATTDQPPFAPDLPRIQAASRQYNVQVLPHYTWPDTDPPEHREA